MVTKASETLVSTTDDIAKLIDPSQKELQRLTRLVSKKTHDLINIPFDIDTWYKSVITDKFLLSLLEKKPTLWMDIQRKIKKFLRDHKIEQLTNQRQYEELTQQLLESFLISEKEMGQLKNQKIIVGNFQEQITHNIVKNKRLIQYVQKDTPISFIEYSTHLLFGQSETSEQIERLLVSIIRRNTGREWNEILAFNKIFRKIIEHIQGIFWIDITKSLRQFSKEMDIKEFGSLYGPAKIIHQWLQETKWRSQRDAALFLRAIYAWWNLDEIYKAQKKAKVAQKELFTHIKRLWGYRELADMELLNSDRESKMGIEFHIPLPNLEQYPIIIESGIKSIRSILIKLYADEKYNDKDALNDLLWIRTMLNRVPIEHHAEIIAWINRFFWTHAFIFKNKDLLDGMEDIKNLWSKTSKQPFTIDSKKSARSSTHYKDCKYYWYLDSWISETPISAEWQFFQNKEDPSPLWEAHHSILNAKKIIQWWVRGEHMITAKQIFIIIYNECRDKKTGIFPSWLSAQEIFLACLKINFIVPYAIWKWKEKMVIFGIKGYRYLLEKDYPSAQKIIRKDLWKLSILTNYIHGAHEAILEKV
ncbi:MAG: hypothetical protein ACD_71C00100G0002 [uncultured bacterium (gcode 4)]|uniref:Uncharacterized protein n=1 Tax=uncultured bacterium (gcode 4) TaxID=1234023 RepID=K1ZJG1_9BACT|nr:MAG: hypothetical protein ACD_71C00100G0002 [uncultured bacterium (gcode 4)]